MGFATCHGINTALVLWTCKIEGITLSKNNRTLKNCSLLASFYNEKHQGWPQSQKCELREMIVHWVVHDLFVFQIHLREKGMLPSLSTFCCHCTTTIHSIKFKASLSFPTWSHHQTLVESYSTHHVTRLWVLTGSMSISQTHPCTYQKFAFMY